MSVKVMFIDGFDGIEGLKEEYDIDDSDLVDVDILYAAYETGYYCGSSIVLFKKDEKLFIVEAGHCSCYGLEGQWDPVETNEQALKMEIDAKASYKFDDFKSFIVFCRDYFKWGE